MTVKNRFAPPVSKGLDTGNETLVQQQFKDQADINQVITRFKRTGQLHSTPGVLGQKREPSFGIYSYNDYQDAYLNMQKIRQDFLALPPKLRQRFDNNPANVVAFVDDPNNHKEAVKLGLRVLEPGYAMQDNGEIIEQTDLVKASEKPQEQAPAPKADPEANSRK